jgi:sec-independent protein translocase protein TatA
MVRRLMHLGTTEILLILVIVLLLFGGKRIPELMRGLGRGAKEFKEGLRSDEDKPAEKKPDNQNKPEDGKS